MSWYELNEKDRISKLYSKYTIKDFWDWWSESEYKVMEVRITNYNLIRETAKKFGIYYSTSGVYVWNADMLKRVIGFVRDKATMWFGVNPRKKNWNRWGKKSFGSGGKGGSSDMNMDSIDFIFIDIDRKNKVGKATGEELKNCDIVANYILDRFASVDWTKRYLKICSGNGVQLLIALDVPMRLPNVEFDGKSKIYLPNSEFEELQLLLLKGIGLDIVKFTRKYKDELGVIIDKPTFNINRVGAIPVTKNYKYGGFTWRGIVEMESGVNEGLSDYVLLKLDDVKKYREENIFVRSKSMYVKDRIKPGKLMENPVARFLYYDDFPEGYINNTLWLQLKILLRDSKFDLNSLEFRNFHEAIKRKHKRTFTLNLPGRTYIFNPTVVNNYCIHSTIAPVYELWPNRIRKQDMKLEGLNWEIKDVVEGEIQLESDTDILEDMKRMKKLLKEGEVENVNKIGTFIKGCLKKYGEERTRYYYNTIFKRFFNYE